MIQLEGFQRTRPVRGLYGQRLQFCGEFMHDRRGGGVLHAGRAGVKLGTGA